MLAVPISTLRSDLTNLLLLQEELEALRAKFEKVDKERQELKQNNEKLDSRVSFSLFIFTHFLLVNCNFPNG